MAGIEDLIDVFRGERIKLNPFRTSSSADMNPGGKIKVGKYATTSANEAANYASKKFPNVIKTTQITPKEFKIGQRVFNEVTSDFSERPNIIKKIPNKIKDFTRDRSGQLGYQILSSKNKALLKTDVLKTIASNAKALTPLAMKGLTFLSSLPVATVTMFLQSTPANSDEINMKLEYFAKLAEENQPTKENKATGGRVGYALGSPEPLEISDREKTIAFDLFQRLKDIEEQYTGERIVGDSSPLNLDTGDKGQGTLMADASTEMDQAPDSFLRPRRYDIIEGKELPAETLEDFDVMFRKPNATGGRVMLANGSSDLVKVTESIKAEFPNGDFNKYKYGFPKSNPNYEKVRSKARFEQRSLYNKKLDVQDRRRISQNKAYQDPEKRKKILERNKKFITQPDKALARKKYLQNKYYYGGQREKDLTRLKGVTVFKNLGGYLQNPDNILLKDMIRAAEQNPNSGLKIIRGGSNNTVVAVKEGNKIYHAVGAKRLPVEGAPKNSTSIVNHPAFKKRAEFVKQQKTFKNTKVPNKNITYGQALDILESKKAGTPLQNKNPAEFEHVKGVATDYKKGQIALRTANREKQVIMSALTNGNITKAEADKALKKIGVRDFYKGKYIGAPKIDSSKQFNDLTKYVDRLIDKDPDLIKATKISDLTKITGVTTADKIARPEKALVRESFKKLSKPGIMGALKASRFLPVVGAIATPALAAYGLYDAYKKGYTRPDELLASAAFGSGVSLKDKIKYEKSKEPEDKDGLASLMA